MTSPPSEPLGRQHTFRRILIIACIGYLGICGFLMAMESRLVYHPPRPREAVEQALALKGEEVWFASGDQTKLHGWYFPNPNAKHAIVTFHGNGEDAEHNLEWAAELRDRLKAAVFTFDYRGYGHSEGEPFEQGVVSDGIAAQQWLANHLQLKPTDIILYGRSLGGGVAIAAAEQLGAQAIIVESTFANMVDVAASRYPFIPVRRLMRNNFLSQDRVKSCDAPFLQFHGTEDVVVPIEFARPLCDAAPAKNKQFVEIPGFGHNDNLPENCWKTLIEFLDSLPPVKSTS